MPVGDCAGLLGIPARQVTLEAGQRIDVHMTEEGTGLHGDHWVPALITDEGAVISGSRPIMEWAAEHPAPASAKTDAAA